MTATAIEPPFGDFLVALGKALIEVGQKTGPATGKTSEPAPPIIRPKGPPDQITRYRMQERVLGELERRGGTMTYVAFKAYAQTKASYGRGFTGFYAKSKAHPSRLCTLTGGEVNITEAGTKRLAWLRAYLAESDS